MKDCTECGNPIDDSRVFCPFCECQQQSSSQRRTKQGIRIATLNLKEDLPSVDEAMFKLERNLLSLKRQRVLVVRIVHGWGSSGTGGRIKVACHGRLAVKQRQKSIRGYLPGDDYSDRTNAGRALLSAYPSLWDSLRTDTENPGITFVEL